MTEQQKVNAEKKKRKLDIPLTLDNAKEALYEYRKCLLKVDDEYLPKLTPSYSLEPVSTVNEYNGSTERVIAFLDEKQERERHIEKVAKAVNRMLTAEYQKLIIMQYIMRNAVGNKEMQRTLNRSEVHFYRVRNKALLEFAEALGVEVYQHKTD